MQNIDHIITAMQPHWEAYRDQFAAEQKTGTYKKFSDNPYYADAKAILDAMNIIRQQAGFEKITMRDAIAYML